MAPRENFLNVRGSTDGARVLSGRDFSLENNTQPKFDSCGDRGAKILTSGGTFVDAGPWCSDYKLETTGGPGYKSMNQALVGNKQHPRTYVAPIITPPSYDLDHWKKNEFNSYFSQINRPRQQDLYLSGYVSGGPCAPKVGGCGSAIMPNIVKENFAAPASGGYADCVEQFVNTLPVNSEGKGIVTTTNTMYGGDGGMYDLYAAPPRVLEGGSGGGREAILAAAEDTAKKNVARMYAREFSQGPLDPGVVNGEFISNAVDGGYQDPFREDCRIPTTDRDFVNPAIKNSCKWECDPPVRPAPRRGDGSPQGGSVPTPPNLNYVSKLGRCSSSCEARERSASRSGMCSKSSGPSKLRMPRQPIAFTPYTSSTPASIRENFEYSTDSPSAIRRASRTVDSTLPPSGGVSYGASAIPYSHGEEYADSPRYPYYDRVAAEETEVGNDYVDTECGYDPLAPEHGLQVNRCVGPKQLEQNYINYNKNQGMQIVQPGMYYQSEVLDPLNANIGISYSQQFNPQTATATAPGEVVYTDHDARQHVGENYVSDAITGEELQNIYDPRYTGYASNDRYYVDTMTGQPRFFYDDIDGVKRPSYIVRSNVDHLGYFDQTGAMKHGKLDFDYRQIANNEFHESALDLRSDIQTRLARMNYARTAQLRDKPLSNTGRLRGR